MEHLSARMGSLAASCLVALVTCAGLCNDHRAHDCWAVLSMLGLVVFTVGDDLITEHEGHRDARRARVEERDWGKNAW